MSTRQFGAPPVVFPNSGGVASIPTHRRNAASGPGSFQPVASNQNPLPFMTFDVGSTSAASSPPLFVGGSMSSGAATFEDEPPLLEELGINTREIWRKTLSILNPIRINPSLHEDADLSGPFIFLMAFGLFQLLAGKFHFGIILGWVIVAAFFLYFIFNMLAGRVGSLDLYRCVSLVGYCMLPIVIFSAASLFMPRGSVLIFGIGMVFVLWSTRVCTKLLADLASAGEEHRGLISYACWLVYMLFSLLVIF